jgi:hypothetical protein
MPEKESRDRGGTGKGEQSRDGEVKAAHGVPLGNEGDRLAVAAGVGQSSDRRL